MGAASAAPTIDRRPMIFVMVLLKKCGDYIADIEGDKCDCTPDRLCRPHLGSSRAKDCLQGLEHGHGALQCFPDPHRARRSQSRRPWREIRGSVEALQRQLSLSPA